jgi:outer membrane murein-binding lipoprotein Lpp
MRLLLYAALAAGFLTSSCMASDNKGKRSDDNSKPVSRIEALAKDLTQIMKEASADMLPILGAVGKEGRT